MKNPLVTTLMHFSAAMDIPIYYYSAGDLSASFPDDAKDYPPPQNYVNAAAARLGNTEETPYIYTRSSSVFGFLPVTTEKEAFLLVGPIPMLFYAEDDLQHIFAHYNLSPEEQEKCRMFFCGIPSQTFSTFGKKLEMMHYILNQGRPKINYDVVVDRQFWGRVVMTAVENTYKQNILSTHNESLHYEAVLTGIVEMGNVQELEKIQDSFFRFETGTLAENPMRNMKNLIIALITVLARAAIRGGLDAQTALHLSDTYIQNTEKAKTRDDLFQVIYGCLLTYTTQVAEMHKTQSLTGDIDDIIRYIRDHVDLPLTCTYLANLFGYSSSYLSKKFKRETGMGFAAFITQTKLTDSKKLLKYSNRSLSEISFYYNFSSQSHFQNAFKKQFGITPLQYRLKTKENWGQGL